MFENYEESKLIVGELSTLIQVGGIYGITEHLEGPFIFYETNDSQKYIEIFTEEEYGIYGQPSENTGKRRYKISENPEFNKFGKTYISNNETLDKYLSEEEKQIKKNGKLILSKKRLIEIYNDIHEQHLMQLSQKRKEEEKLEKQYIKSHISGSKINERI